jgi:hypothetical protein
MNKSFPNEFICLDIDLRNGKITHLHFSIGKGILLILLVWVATLFNNQHIIELIASKIGFQ